MGRGTSEKQPGNGGYITQMLRELSKMAEEKDPDLHYFIQMAMKHSYDVDCRALETVAPQKEDKAA